MGRMTSLLGFNRRPPGAPKVGIDPEHVAWALQRRPRMSFQALGRALGVNAHDLQRACEAATRGGAG